MVVSIYSTKGGVGKTSLANSLSRDMGLKYITNDLSVVVGNYNKASYHGKTITLKQNTLYDFGGFKSEEALKIATQSDIVLIPVINDANAVMKALMALKELKEVVNVYVIATMIDNKKDYTEIKQVINHHFPQREVIYFRRTKLLKNAMDAKQGALSFLQNNKNAHVYRNSVKDYEKIFSLVKEYYLKNYAKK